MFSRVSIWSLIRLSSPVVAGRDNPSSPVASVRLTTMANRKTMAPKCAVAMGCLCAGHARGNPASFPCDTSEPRAEIDTDGLEGWTVAELRKAIRSFSDALATARHDLDNAEGRADSWRKDAEAAQEELRSLTEDVSAVAAAARAYFPGFDTDHAQRFTAYGDLLEALRAIDTDATIPT